MTVENRTFIERLLETRRSIEQAFADLVAKFESEPAPELARMVGTLGLEVLEREIHRSKAAIPMQEPVFLEPQSVQQRSRAWLSLRSRFASVPHRVSLGARGRQMLS